MAGIEAFFEEQEEDEVVDLGKEIETPEEPPVEPETPPEPEPEVEDPVVPEAGEPEPESEDPTSETISSLRQLLREQALEIEKLKGQSQRLTESLTESGHIDESISESTEEPIVSPARAEVLGILAETMKVNPVYQDFEDVCSQTNFERTVDALAKMEMQEKGGSLTEHLDNVTKYIWSLSNPYKFVYDIVKQHHPKYAAPKQESVPKPAAPKAPPSIGNIPGGNGAGNEGWTAAKIDALPEDKLDTVPAAIYEKYMQNELA